MACYDALMQRDIEEGKWGKVNKVGLGVGGVFPAPLEKVGVAREKRRKMVERGERSREYTKQPPFVKGLLWARNFTAWFTTIFPRTLQGKHYEPHLPEGKTKSEAN